MAPLDTGQPLTGETYQYPPDLLVLLRDTIAVLCRSKKDVITFFKGCGVQGGALADVSKRVDTDRHSISKRDIANTILVRLNEGGDLMLGLRREVIKRVVEFEDFGQCWSEDQDKARGLVGRTRELVGQKDAFTRMKEERDREARARRQPALEAVEAQRQRREEMEGIRTRLGQLLAASDPHKRGVLFQDVLSDLFRENHIYVREAFVRVGPSGEGVVEQIDGAVELDKHLLLVEAKWWAEKIGPVEVNDLLSKLQRRADTRGLFVSASGYTPGAIDACREALDSRVVALCTLEEIVRVLEAEYDFADFLREKVRAAQLDKNPLYEVPLSP